MNFTRVTLDEVMSKRAVVDYRNRDSQPRRVFSPLKNVKVYVINGSDNTPVYDPRSSLFARAKVLNHEFNASKGCAGPPYRVCIGICQNVVLDFMALRNRPENVLKASSEIKIMKPGKAAIQGCT